jgi:hypothetical protein
VKKKGGKFDNVDEELRIARALRNSLLAERDSLMALSPEQRSRALASAETVLDLLEQLERLELARHAIVKSMRLANSESLTTTSRSN